MKWLWTDEGEMTWSSAYIYLPVKISRLSNNCFVVWSEWRSLFQVKVLRSVAMCIVRVQCVCVCLHASVCVCEKMSARAPACECVWAACISMCPSMPSLKWMQQNRAYTIVYFYVICSYVYKFIELFFWRTGRPTIIHVPNKSKSHCRASKYVHALNEIP